MSIQPVLAINPANAAVQYLANTRLESNAYRGAHKSQHNRYDLNRVEIILRSFNRFSGGSRMKIRTQDISRRPHNIKDEADYAAFCDDVKLVSGIGSQDAMRKNLFVDFDRMGLIQRIDAKGTVIPAGKRAKVSEVALSVAGKALVDSKSLIDSQFVYSSAIDRLLGGTVDIIVDVLGRIQSRKLSVYEYMFFVSAVGASAEIALARDEAADLVLAFRALSRTQQTALIDEIRKFANPDSFDGDKPDKRDFHNWKNECDQTFGLLGQTVYFERRLDGGINSPSELFLRADASSPVNARRMARSLAEKQKYFSEHGTGKVLGFELHHVVSLGSSLSIQHFLMLDSWKNMIYLDGFNHAKITQAGNLHVLMSFSQSGLLLTRHGNPGDSISLSRPQNVRYSEHKRAVMKRYNEDLNGI